MEKCQRCGKEFDREEEEYRFNELAYGDRNFDNFNETLCADCAAQVINNEEEGVYFEYCEDCGKKYDPFVENGDFTQMTENAGWFDVEYNDYTRDRLRCAECAFEEWEAHRNDNAY